MTYFRNQPSIIIFAVAGWLAAGGLGSIAELRTGRYAARGRDLAASPVPYGRLLPATAALGPGRDGAPRAVVRADSAGPRAARLCAAAPELGADADVAWVAFSGEVPACLRAAAVRPPDALRREMGAARWVVVGADGRALYSARGVPEAALVRSTLALFRERP